MNHAEHTRWQEAVRHLLAVHRPEQAEQLVRRRLAAHPEEAAAQELLGLVLLNQPSRNAEALAVVREAIALDPQQSDAHYFHSVALLRDSQPDAALQAIGEALRLEPRGVTYLGYKAVILNARRQRAQALVVTEAGLALDPSHLECLFQRITALQRLGRWAEAATTIQQLARWHPNRAVTHFLQGETARRNQDVAGAEAHFREAIRLTPSHQPARKALLEVLEQQADAALLTNNVTRAAALFEEILVLEPEQPGARQQLYRTRLLQHWTQRPFRWAHHNRHEQRNAAIRAITQALLIMPMGLAWGARGLLRASHLWRNVPAPARGGWFYTGLAWSLLILLVAAFSFSYLPVLWLLALGGLVFPLRSAALDWRRGQKRWPLGAQLLLPSGALALLNAHTTYLTPEAALESRRFLATFGVMLLAYQFLQPLRRLQAERQASSPR